jgi:hypothetical protein
MDDEKIIIDRGYYKNIKHYNTDEWRASALHFEEFGCYTKYPVNDHPSSRYYKFWEEEARRSVYGYDIGRDKISGYFYWYLNYCPIYKAIELGVDVNEVDKDDLVRLYEQAQADREFRLPDFWDGDYQYFWYLDDAETAGEHGVIIKTRGRGYSFKGGSMCDRNFYLIPGSKSFVFADDKAYLIEDGLLSKCWEMMDHIEQHTPWGKRRQKHDTSLYKRASYVVDSGGRKIEKGFKSEIIGISLKNNWNKARGKRGKLILYEESGKNPNLLKAWNVSLKSMQQGRLTFGLQVAFGCVCAGTKVWNKNGDLINIEDLCQSDGILGYNGINISKENITYIQEKKQKECIRITTHTGKYLECSVDHPIYTYIGQKYPKKIRQKKYRINGSVREYRKLERIYSFLRTDQLKINDRIAIVDEVPVFGKKKMWEPRFIGWLIGDGSYGYNKTPVLSNCDDEINNYILRKFDTRIEKIYFTKQLKIYQETRIKGICDKLRKLGIYGQTKNKKRLPDDINKYCKNDLRNLLGGLFDTDGYVQKRKGGIRINFTSSSKDLCEQIMFLLMKFGIHSNIQIIVAYNRIRRISDKNEYYRLCIDDQLSVFKFKKNIKLFPKEKQKRLNESNLLKYRHQISKSSILKGIRLERVVKIEYIGLKDIYNLTANTTHTYIANGIITHNTGGTEDEDFMGLEQLHYQGGAYNIHLIPNIWDEGAANTKCGHFVSVEQNLEGAMDEYGNSIPDIARKLTDFAREKVIKNTKNPEAIIRYIAEEPRCPQEAVMRIGGTIFPINDLKHHMNYLLANPDRFEETEYLGILGINEENEKVEWRPDSNVKPIQKFPELDKNNTEGAIVIWEHPVEIDGIIPWGLYIAGNDTYDHDESTTDSLGSTFIMNRITERIVAEYTGRPRTADAYYENVRRLLLYYRGICNYENNWKGLFTYLNNKHSSHLLCDTPKIIVDKIFDKSLLNRGKGTPGTLPIQKWGREKILVWLTTPITPGSEILNLHRIRSIPLLQELIYWNTKGNFDRVDALQMLMILKEDMQNIEPEDVNKKPQNALSPFFARMEMFQEKLKQSNDPFKKILNNRQ